MFSFAPKKGTKMEKLMKVLRFTASLALIATVLLNAFPAAFAQADPTQQADAAAVIDGILSIVYLITNVVGVIFVIVGFVKLAISYAQEDGPSQQKAALFIATGLVLILLRLVLSGIGFSTWVTTTFT